MPRRKDKRQKTLHKIGSPESGFHFSKKNSHHAGHEKHEANWLFQIFVFFMPFVVKMNSPLVALKPWPSSAPQAPWTG
jgi:hypothetical protein